jgi:hypothetical protein
VPYSGARLALLPGIIVVLWAAGELQATLLSPWALPYFIPLNAAVLLGTSIAFAPVAERMTHVTRDASGGGSYRIGFSITALFAAAFVVRLVAAVLLFPGALVYGAPPGGYPPVAQQMELEIIDALFSFSVGLLVGRAIGVARRWSGAGPSSRAP